MNTRDPPFNDPLNHHHHPPKKKQVRRAQEAVLSTRPFNEGLQSVFSGLVKRLALENIELPLLQVCYSFLFVSRWFVCRTGRGRERRLNWVEERGD